jgi:transposase
MMIMSHTSPSQIEIPAEIEREMTPAVRDFFERMSVFWQARLKEYEARIEELEREVKQLRGPHNQKPGKPAPKSDGGATASKAPSADPPKRRRGGQPGHPKSARPLIPTSQCDEVHELVPDACRKCGESLAGRDSDPLRHQVYELPAIKPIITEYQLHRLTCPCCDTTTCAALPAGVPTGQSGPRLIAFCTLLMASFRQSKRRVAYFLELLNIPGCPGLVVKMQSLATKAVQPAYKQLERALPKQDVLYIDETPTSEQNNNAWIWVAVAPTFTFFAVRLTKAASVIHELLTLEFNGTVVSDRAKAYLWLKYHQWCWAHLKRDFEKMAAASGNAGKVGQKLLDMTHQMFHDWHRYRDGTLTRIGLKRILNRFHGQMYLLLEEGRDCAHAPTAGACASLLSKYDSIWTFKDKPNVKPTNNDAERALRHGVIWKHLSFGTQSDGGSRFVETMLTIVETCRQQKRNPFDYLTKSVARYLQGKKPTPLLTRV